MDHGGSWGILGGSWVRVVLAGFGGLWRVLHGSWGVLGDFGDRGGIVRNLGGILVIFLGGAFGDLGGDLRGFWGDLEGS